METFSTNTICYEATQRTLRNAVVAFLRDHLSSAFPQDHLERLKKPFTKEWPDLEAAAAEARATGGTVTQVKDAYDLLSVTHFYSLFDAYHPHLFSSPLALELGLEKPSKPKLLGALKAIKDSRDPLSHPVEEDVPYEEAVGVLSDVRQVLMALSFHDKAQAVADQIRTLNPRYTVDAAPICVLPTQDSIYVDFVGRQTVLRCLEDLYNGAFSKRCLIAGDGGKGKSAVAYRYAQTIAAHDKRFKMIVWLSAKKKRFQAGATISIQTPDFSDLGSAVDALLAQYGPVEAELSLERKRALLLELLDEFPTFIVADDIDSVLDDPDVVSLFTFEIPSTASRVLLTSRRDIPGVRSLTIAGFSPVEGDLFIQSRIHQYALEPTRFSPSVFKLIREACDGSPLYIDDLIRLTRIVEPAKAVSLWKERSGDEARRYALERELEQLSQDARSVLTVAVISDGPVSFAELQGVLNYSEDRLVLAMTELHTMFLLPQPSQVEGEQRYHINFNTKQLVKSVEAQSDLYKRLEEKSKALSGQLPAVRRDEVGQLIRQALLLYYSGRFDDGETLLLRSIDRFPNVGDLHGFLAYLYKSEERITDARFRFEKAAQLRTRNIDTFIHWVKMELAEREYNSAARAAEIGLKLVPSAYKLQQLKADAKYFAAKDWQARAQTERAEKLWREVAEDIEKNLRAKSASDEENQVSMRLLQRLVVCLDHLGDIGDLNVRFSQWKREYPDDPALPRMKDIFSRRRGGLFKPK